MLTDEDRPPITVTTLVYEHRVPSLEAAPSFAGGVFDAAAAPPADDILLNQFDEPDADDATEESFVGFTPDAPAAVDDILTALIVEAEGEEEILDSEASAIFAPSNDEFPIQSSAEEPAEDAATEESEAGTPWAATEVYDLVVSVVAELPEEDEEILETVVGGLYDEPFVETELVQPFISDDFEEATTEESAAAAVTEAEQVETDFIVSVSSDLFDEADTEDSFFVDVLQDAVVETDFIIGFASDDFADADTDDSITGVGDIEEAFIPPIVEGSGGGGGGGGGRIWYQGRRHRPTLLDLPNMHLDDILRRVEAEVLYSDLKGEPAYAAAAAAAEKLIKPFKNARTRAVDWAALERDATRTGKLFKLWADVQLRKQRRRSDDDDFMMME